MYEGEVLRIRALPGRKDCEEGVWVWGIQGLVVHHFGKVFVLGEPRAITSVLLGLSVGHGGRRGVEVKPPLNASLPSWSLPSLLPSPSSFPHS